MITILMAVYAGDNPIYFGDALASIESQETIPDEVIIVQDGPINDELNAIIDHFRCRLNIKSPRLLNNKGLSYALNYGLRYATQPWIMRFDSDDICLPNRLSLQKKVMLSDAFDFFGGQIIEFNEKVDTLIGIRDVPLHRREILKMLPRRSPFNHVTVCFKRELYQGRNLYTENVGLEDYRLWGQLISEGYRFGNMADIVVKVRAGGGMISRRSGWRYLKDEFLMRQYFHKIGAVPILKNITWGCIRLIAFSFPAPLKKFIYSTFLRRKVSSLSKASADGATFPD